MKQLSYDEVYQRPQTSSFSIPCENEDKYHSKTGIQKNVSFDFVQQGGVVAEQWGTNQCWA